MSLLTQIGTGGIKDNAVTTPKIADANVTTPKIDDGDITTAKLADSAVTSVKTAGIETPKNILINGGMHFAQRTSSAAISGSGYATADRWRTEYSGLGNFTQTLSTDVPTAVGTGFPRSLKMDCTTADASPAASDKLWVEQRIEGQNLQHLLKGTSNAISVSLSFWVKSNKTGTYIIRLQDNDNTRSICQSYTISSANTWEKKELTFAGDTTGALDYDNGFSLAVQWWLGAGSDFTSGTLQTSWAADSNPNLAVGQVNLADSTSNEWYMTGCQLEVGAIANNFEHEPIDVTLKKCQRYYFRPHNGVYGWQGRRGGGRFFRVNNATQGTLTFPTTMRAAPSFSATRTYGDGIWTNGTCYASNEWSNASAPDFVNYQSNVNPESGSGNGGTFGFSVNVTAEI